MNKFYENLIKKSLLNENTKDLSSFLKNCNGCFIVDCIKFLLEEETFKSKKQKILR